MSNQQRNVLRFIARNPGCTAADVTRHEWSGRGHAASYDRVARLRRRGLVRVDGSFGGAGLPLVLTERGMKAVSL